MGGKIRAISAGLRSRYVVDALEPRRMLAAAVFEPPVVTALPAGFQFAGVVGSGQVDLGYTPELIVKRAGGGGLLMGWNADGTFSVKRSLDTTGEILAFEDAGNTSDHRMHFWTTAGQLELADDGSLIGRPLVMPSDVVAGTAAQFNDGILAERFTPDAATPGRGTVRLAYFTFDVADQPLPEVDTVVGAGVSAPASGVPVARGDGIVIAQGREWVQNSDGTFQATALDLPGLNDRTLFYRAWLAYPYDIGAAGDGVLAYPVNDGAGNDEIAVLRGTGSGLAVVYTTVVGPTGNTTAALIGGWTNGSVQDFATVITSGPDARAVEVLPARGDGRFLSPEVLPQSIALVPIGDASQSNPPYSFGMLCTQTTAQGTSLVTLFDVAARGPVVSFASTANPSTAGEPVTISAVVPGYASQTVSFYDGQTKLGDVVAGDDQSASLTLSGLSVGDHSITVRQTGTFAFVSNAFVQTVRATQRSAPYVVVTGVSLVPTVTLSGSIQAGSDVNVSLTLKNLGGAISSGTVDVALVATTNGASDASTRPPGETPISVPLDVPTFKGVALKLGAGKSVTLTGVWKPSVTMPQRYYVVNATVSGAAALGLSPALASAFVFAPTILIVWGFGGDTPASSFSYVRDLGGGDVVTFSLTGGGTGIVFDDDPSGTLANGTPDFQVVLYSTTKQSNLTITQTGTTRPNIVSLAYQQAKVLGTADLRQDTPHSIDFEGGYPTGSVGKLMIGTVPPAAPRGSAAGTTPTVAGSVTVTGTLLSFSADSLSNCNVNVTGDTRTPMLVDVGTISAGGVFQTTQPIESMTVGSAQPGSRVEANLIGRLDVTHDFDADLTLAQSVTAEVPALGTATIGGSISGANDAPVRWHVTGNVGTIDVSGNVQNFFLNGDGSIGSIVVGGDVAGSTFESANNPPVTAAPAPAQTHLVFATQPTVGVAGHKLPRVAVELEDADGKLITSGSSTITLKLASGAGTGTVVATAPLINGVATFTGIVLRSASFYSYVAEGGGATSALSSSFVVAPDRAYRLKLLDLAPSSLGHGLYYGDVEILDRYGNRLHNSTAALKFRAIPASNPAGISIGSAIGVGGPAVFVDGLASFALHTDDYRTVSGWLLTNLPRVKPAPSVLTGTTGQY